MREDILGLGWPGWLCPPTFFRGRSPDWDRSGEFTVVWRVGQAWSLPLPYNDSKLVDCWLAGAVCNCSHLHPTTNSERRPSPHSSAHLTPPIVLPIL